ncbi:hypothetical protein KUTeg_018861 [Tegillarca granosa]|uniref:DDE Tnp4 domain-containing protein n=1 Tax=Tegillarca granosa TaxID=220873 RepID=A0ABQ9EBA8_TEGGR|nr:hypothetical protein KUTeg_018861 [Tegillarca granosa]
MAASIPPPQKGKQKSPFHKMTCNHKFTITSVAANVPESAHHQRIFKTAVSAEILKMVIYKYKNRKEKDIQTFSRAQIKRKHNGLLLGNSGYQCRPFLMTPYLVTDTQPKVSFNKALCITRASILQTFGILKRRFPCLTLEMY